MGNAVRLKIKAIIRFIAEMRPLGDHPDTMYQTILDGINRQLGV